ncbi:carbohydrate ABC transporter permease [Agromyces cerinus]|uniref:Carbohydrate ABC transporter membrane protein 1, CUT1 family n=1 Tax=Agromyces cerinus subsp. cerinus TaxID=232089 RepID=A0A1N6E7V2_9MICO|nr:sugar ABC transporter permease [Agromyces cerinus]SIN79100.1 carbohydrate ABC transporter membrane protein 1, CUT1 family [Agromyces cerinus subsp. cerinus]
MNDIVTSIEEALGAVGLPEGLRPIGAFLVILLCVYAVFLVPLWIAVRRRWVARSTAAFWCFISPWVFGFLFFTVGPMVYSLVLSFYSWDLISDPVFVGGDNYVRAAQDPKVYRAIQVTLTYAVVSVPLGVIISLAVALLLNLRVAGINVFRTVWYLPSLVTGVALVVLFLWVFNPNYGLINGVLAVLGIDGPAWFADPNWALPAVVIMSLWTVGGNMVIYLAGLQDVPTELYEAAHLDGASTMRRFWHITLPQMSPVIFFGAITGLIAAMQTFTQGYIVTQSGGGPNDSLLFFVLYLYNNAFKFFQMGYASALAWILLVMILLITVLVFRGSAFWVYYESTNAKARKRARK